MPSSATLKRVAPALSMSVSDEATGRPGSAADLSRRMDRLEANHESLTKEVASLAGTVARVEQNQNHAEELNKLRFTALDTAVGTLGADLKGFMARIEGMISGEVDTAQAREGRELVADYKKWRGEVDDALEKQAVLTGRLDLLGRLAVIVISTNVLAIAAAIYAVVQG